MASQVNSQFAYINLINGETIWERLRIVRNFIEDRKIAKKLQSTQDIKRLAHVAKVNEATKESERLFAQAELEEFDAHAEQQEDGYKKLDDELKFLLRYEAELASIAEQTRVPGVSDDEMYQLNMGTEVVLRNMRKIETERVANMIGCSLATAEESMRVPEMRDKMLATAQAMMLPAGSPEQAEMASLGLNFAAMPLSVQSLIALDQKLKIGL